MQAVGQAVGKEGPVDRDLIRRHAVPVPRYTSYPTAPHFSADVGPARYEQWLVDLPQEERLSLYVHIPYCTSLCWYCGCNTKATRRYRPIASYLEALEREIAFVGSLMPARHAVAHMHWGGGSPNVLSPSDVTGLARRIRSSFQLAADLEFAVEIDPRDLDEARVTALCDAGVTRISLGVQDFHLEVQKAIGRMQSFEDTQRAIEAFRARGVGSINIDLMYGLPLQTLESVDDTIGQVIALAPERIAIFGYAHLPERMRQQRLIPDASLPDIFARYAQSSRMAARLIAAGYVRVGLDHFARPGDGLAAGTVNRNFQGYTSDDVETLIGLGASAIGQLPQGFVQNAVSPADYARRVMAGGLATAKGLALTDDDRMRGWVIKELMCTLAFSRARLRQRFGAKAAHLLAVADEVVAQDADGLVVPSPDGFAVTERGRHFVRSICARFDAHLARSRARHSVGV
ncbi:MAG: oxygen-independent coproporphyrinogen III oxidase [Hyphomicrobiaceae bacterium]|nr:oxygen-independent coproporphyrinogen III oxidase [Hyphomicrobiaceae bacterium]